MNARSGLFGSSRPPARCFCFTAISGRIPRPLGLGKEPAQGETRTSRAVKLIVPNIWIAENCYLIRDMRWR
jgi:hypothetical protein